MADLCDGEPDSGKETAIYIRFLFIELKNALSEGPCNGDTMLRRVRNCRFIIINRTTFCSARRSRIVTTAFTT